MGVDVARWARPVPAEIGVAPVAVRTDRAVIRIGGLTATPDGFGGILDVLVGAGAAPSAGVVDGWPTGPGSDEFGLVAEVDGRRLEPTLTAGSESTMDNGSRRLHHELWFATEVADVVGAVRISLSWTALEVTVPGEDLRAAARRSAAWT